MHHVIVGGYYIPEDDGEISGLVFACEAIGACEPSFFYPETPLPFEVPDDPNDLVQYSAEFTIDPPLDGFVYRYQPYGVRPDGSLVSAWSHCDADSRGYALVSCSEAPFARGRLIFDLSCQSAPCLRLEGCEPSCWPELVWDVWDLETAAELSGGMLGELVGQVVDVYGERTYCSMPGGAYYTISRFALAPDNNCGGVPVEIESWGTLKSQFR